MSSTVKATDVYSYPTVAVMQFGNKAITSQGLRRYDFDSASEYAIYQLLASGWFDLVDYEQLSNRVCQELCVKKFSRLHHSAS